MQIILYYLIIFSNFALSFEKAMEDIENLKYLLSIPKDIIITTHRNPDGDAIGSSLALYHLLVQDGHTVHIITPSEYPSNFEWMNGIDKILIYDIDTEMSNILMNNASIIFALDFNSLDRIDKLGEHMQQLNAKFVMIDHHLYPEPFADFVLSDTSASSTCELVYEFIGMLGKRRNMNLDIATSIYTGISTDTGSFRYSTSPRVFAIVGELVAMGINDVEIQNNIYNSLSYKQLSLIGHALNNRIELMPEHKAGIIYLTKKDFEDYTIQRGDTEGIVNYLLLLKDLKVAVFITEQPNIIKLSLRSKGDFSVQEICRKYFNGGGHKNASGGYSHKNLKATVQQVKEILEEYKYILN